MSYYQGDFYRGDYYRGDPGFLGFLKGAIGVGSSLLPVPGASTFGKLASKVLNVLPGGGAALKGAVARAGSIVAKHPVLSAAAAAGTVGGIGSLTMRKTPGAAAGIVAPGLAGAGMRGFHVSKRTGALVRNRRMRVTNVRALRRAIRRCTGFAHLAKRVLRFTSPRPPRGRPVFRHRRRTKRV